MPATLTAPAKTKAVLPSPEVTGRFLLPNTAALALSLADPAITTPLLISRVRSDPTTYQVSATVEGGRVVAYTLTRDDTGEVYEIDVRFGGGPRYGTCSCNDSKYRARTEGCRHRRGLHTALEALEAKSATPA